MDNVLALLFVAALVGIFKPYIGNLKRRHFAIAAFVSFIAFAAVLPKPQEGKSSQELAEQPQPNSLAKVEVQKVDKLALVRKFQSSILDAMKPCDTAAGALARVAEGLADGRSSVYDGYSAAKRTEDACRQSWSLLSDLKAPQHLTEAGTSKADETIETCSNAAIAKQMAAAHMSKIFDGDMRPSMIEEGREMSNTAQMGVLACVAGVFTVAAAEGVDLEKLNAK